MAKQSKPHLLNLSSETYLASRKLYFHILQMGLGDRIRIAREQADLSQDEVAKAFDISREAVQQWEDGSTMPSTPKLPLLATTLKTTVQWLFEETTEKPLSQSERKLIELYRQCSQTDRADLERMAQRYAKLAGREPPLSEVATTRRGDSRSR